ncbi:MAG: ribosome silencing factor [Clostridiales bacterium]|nr:ribosome silencing factor [Clostridiales bacterium]
MAEEKTTVKSSLANADADTLVKAIVEELDEMKAQDIKIMTVSDKTVVTDYLVICTGNSSTQIKSISGRLEMKMREREVEPLNIDGYAEGTWVVMDYAHVMVHVFHRDMREFYKLEKLWSGSGEVTLNSGNEAK